jgi:hypothetical protein
MDNEKIHLLQFWSKNHMAAGKLDLIIEKGAKFTKHLEYKDKTKTPIDLTGYTARMQARKNPQSTTVVVDLTTENGGITITEVTGEIDLFLSGTATTAITAQGNLVYDLELIEPGPGEPIKLVRGTISLIEEVTK